MNVSLLGQRGAGLLIPLSIMAIVGVMVSGAALTYSLFLEGTRYKIEAAQARRQLQFELKVIFSNLPLCTSQLRVTNNTFHFGTKLAAGAEFNGTLVMDSLNVTNRVANPDGSSTATFVIAAHSKYKSSLLERAAVRATYTNVGANVSSCRLDINAESACESVGAAWIAAESRCGICESIGGTWSATDQDCSIGGT